MLPIQDENRVEMEETSDSPHQVRGSGDMNPKGSLLSERINYALISMQKSVLERLSETRLSKEKRVEIGKEINIGLEKVQAILASEITEIWTQRKLGNAVENVLNQRGITTVGDWMDYISTTERDGELLVEICDVLKTDVSQVKNEIAAPQVAKKGP
ncbi:hypothetical protein GCK32_001238 [Trichostrongylus colubriformis]|uniref:Uncharacterized protein n=1 Tax=Trichostrongylus colubriformis TaxID=6319 RepID=A0AAN8FB93_TRICO